MKIPFLSASVNRDRAIIINGEKIDTLPVLYYDSEEVVTKHQVFPRSDATVKFDPNGGTVFLFDCSLPYLQETEHLKRVEESLVVRNIFEFQNQKRDINIPFILMTIVLVVIVILLR